MCDALTVIPFASWMAVSIGAVVSYAQIGWMAPVCCACYSTVLCGVATAQLWRRTHVRAAIYLTVVPEERSAEQRRALRQRCCRPEVVLAAAFSLIALAWGVLDIAVNASVIAPAKGSIPCDGKCGSCESDPHCTAWAANITAQHPVADLCPPARHHSSSESDATFSCVADGAWMFLVFALTVLWLLSLVLRRPPPAQPKEHKGMSLEEAPGHPPRAAPQEAS